MKMKLLTLATLFVLSSAFTSSHAYYVSITEIVNNKKDNSLEVSMKLFYDDLTAGIYSTEKEHLSTNAEKDDVLIEQYVLSNFDVWVKGENLKGNYLGYELEQDAIWIFIEYPNLVNDFSQIIVKNTTLMGTFDDQTNIINFFPEKGKKKVKGKVLNRKQESGTIKF